MMVKFCPSAGAGAAKVERPWKKARKYTTALKAIRALQANLESTFVIDRCSVGTLGAEWSRINVPTGTLAIIRMTLTT